MRIENDNSNQEEMYRDNKDNLNDIIQPKVKSYSELIYSLVDDKDKMDAILEETTRNVMRYTDLAGISVEELSSRTGISKGQLYKMRNGRAVLGLRSLIKIGFVLQLPPGTFIPYEKKQIHRRSIGDKVNDMCLYCSKKTKNHILAMIKEQVEYEASMEKDKAKRKR